MKKFTLIIFALACYLSPVFSQETETVPPVFPEKGDFQLKLNATPFLAYAGSLFTERLYTPGIQFSADYPGMLQAKYILSNHNAIIGLARFGFTRIEINHPEYKEETTSSNFGIGGGLEFGRTRGRLRSFAGGTAVIGMGQVQNSSIIFYDAPLLNHRTIGGDFISFEISPYAGAEVYFFSKISAGAQLGPTFQYTSTSQIEQLSSGVVTVIQGKKTDLNMLTTSMGQIFIAYTF